MSPKKCRIGLDSVDKMMVIKNSKPHRGRNDGTAIIRKKH